MSGITVKVVDSGQADDMTPPPGTAIVRPVRYVRAVRERYLQRFTDLAEAAASRSARAWGWALGETPIAPVTDQATTVPPDRRAIEVEIAIADERRLRGERENRADSAATILRWLIGADDHVPIRCEKPGELVGGFGDIVRSREQIAEVAALAVRTQRRAAAKTRDSGADPGERQHARQDADHLAGVMVTLAWVGGDRAEAPISRVQSREISARALKRERVHAEDVIYQRRHLSAADWLPSRWYGEGVKSSIDWVLGDSSAPPLTPTAQGGSCPVHEHCQTR